MAKRREERSSHSWYLWREAQALSVHPSRSLSAASWRGRPLRRRSAVKRAAKALKAASRSSMRSSNSIAPCPTSRGISSAVTASITRSLIKRACLERNALVHSSRSDSASSSWPSPKNSPRRAVIRASRRTFQAANACW